MIDNIDPAQQLQWLIDTLQEAEDNDEKVSAFFTETIHSSVLGEQWWQR